MKKGIIIEKRGRQKVVLAENGRFYIRLAKPGEQVGDSVMVSTVSVKVAVAAVALTLFSAAFYGGFYASNEINAHMADTLVQVDFGSAAEFLVNGRGRVLSIAPLSESAAMITLEEDYRGLPIGEAVKKFINYALLCGLVDVEESCNALYIYVVNEDVAHSNSLGSSIKKEIESYLNSNFIPAIVFCNLHSPVASIYASMYECNVLKLRSMYIVSKIYQFSGDGRSTDEILRELRHSDLKSLLNTIREQHIRYSQNLSLKERELLAQKKSLFIQLNKQKFDLLSESALSRYQSFLSAKADYERFFGSNYSEKFLSPAYLSCPSFS
ncbi:MAG: hypothetical protein GX304_05840 [Clostridiales bacterium]|nr:hypothetical protein [Clostridiales bacterium]